MTSCLSCAVLDAGPAALPVDEDINSGPLFRLRRKGDTDVIALKSSCPSATLGGGPGQGAGRV